MHSNAAKHMHAFCCVKERVFNVHLVLSLDQFNSMEDHTCKAVEMNSLTHSFAKNLELEKSQEFVDTFSYKNAYFGKLNGEGVTGEFFGWHHPILQKK